MFGNLTLRTVFIIGSIVLSTVLLSIAVAIRDHFLVFIMLMACFGLVGGLFRARSEDDIDEPWRH